MPICTLMALCFSSENTFFGKAKEYLDLWGLYAFGSREDAFALQSHHKKRVNEYPKLAYHADNIQIQTAYAHRLLQRMRIHNEHVLSDPDNKNLSKTEEILQDDLMNLLDYEEPGCDVAVNVNGEYYYEILSVN